MTGARLLRCHPWCAGGFDAVPHQPPALFRRFITEAAPSTPMSDKTP
jgi:putative component of membrane protein insertase Oxa1/YidC/SpoIIIJ protein YidD